MTGSIATTTSIREPDISGFDTAILYRHLRQQLPDDKLTMQLQLSLSPHPVRPAQDRSHGNHIATTLAALTGAAGCLPPIYEETALEQTLNKNNAYADFIALFQRHLADLLIEANAKYAAHRTSNLKRSARDPFVKALLALVGCDNADDTDTTLLFATHYAALFADDRRNAASLQSMLQDVFCVPVEVIEFYPHWQQVPEDERSFLNAQCRLGINSCLGSLAKNAAGHFRIALGPLDHKQFRKFLPEQPDAKRLSDLIRLYCGIGLSFDVQLIIDKNSIPPACLYAGGRPGYDLWLGTTTHHRNRDDAVFNEQTNSACKSRGNRNVS